MTSKKRRCSFSGGPKAKRARIVRPLAATQSYPDPASQSYGPSAAISIFDILAGTSATNLTSNPSPDASHNDDGDSSEPLGSELASSFPESISDYGSLTSAAGASEDGDGTSSKRSEPSPASEDRDGYRSSDPPESAVGVEPEPEESPSCLLTYRPPFPPSSSFACDSPSPYSPSSATPPLLPLDRLLGESATAPITLSPDLGSSGLSSPVLVSSVASLSGSSLLSPSFQSRPVSPFSSAPPSPQTLTGSTLVGSPSPVALLAPPHWGASHTLPPPKGSLLNSPHG